MSPPSSSSAVMPCSFLPSPLLSFASRRANNSYTYGITFFMGVRALLYPPFLLKTKIQVARGASEQSAFQVAKATVREEGVRGLYKVWCASLDNTEYEVAAAAAAAAAATGGGSAS